MKLHYITDGKRHLICLPFSVENLHVMAAQLDLKRHWYHPGAYPHYDIPVRRKTEIEARCTIVRSLTLLKMIQGRITDVDDQG